MQFIQVMIILLLVPVAFSLVMIYTFMINVLQKIKIIVLLILIIQQNNMN